MANLHFSTIDLRNKLSQGRINNVNPIITQVTQGTIKTKVKDKSRWTYIPLLRCAGEK